MIDQQLVAQGFYNLGWSNGTEFMPHVKAALAICLFLPATALAYMDPGTGSMLLQVILGGVAAVGVALKLYWHRILSALGLRKKAPDSDG